VGATESKPVPGTLKPGKLLFCTDVGYPPMQFVRDGEVVGVEIDLARELAGRLGLEAEFVDQRFDGIVDALYAGRCDAIICAMSESAQRRERLTFVPYFLAGQTIVVQPGNPLGIATVEDLAGRRVLVQDDTSNAERLQELDRENQAKGLAPMLIAGFKGTTGETTERSAAALRAGVGDAEFLDVVNASWRVTLGDALEPTPIVLDEDPYGVAFRKQDAELQQVVCGALAELYADGTMARILGAWELSSLAFDGPERVRISG
jgi:polar amino acid transport system substrate-binding protein